MELNVQQLRMLRALAAHGTMSAAAESLGYTASAVSQQLSGLERASGVVVLERLGRSVRLTNAGRELVRHADVVLSEMEAAVATLEQVRGAAVGVTMVGVMESVTVSLLPAILGEATARYPQLDLRTLEDYAEDPFEFVRSGVLDAAFMVDYPDAPGVIDRAIERLVVCRDWFRLVVPEGWTVPRRRAPGRGWVVDLASLADMPWIAPPERIVLGQMVRWTCRRAGFEPDVNHQIDDYPASLQLVAAGAGVALVPDLGLTFTPPGVAVLELADPVYRSVELAYRRSSRDRPAIQALIEICERVAEQLGLDRTVPDGT